MSCGVGDHGGAMEATGDVRAEFWQDIPDAPDDAELNELRKLLLRREQIALEKLVRQEGEKNYHIQQVSDVIAEAIIARSGRDSQLRMAIEPIVDATLKNSIRKRQQDFVNVLFPLMGPTIRKSIAESFRSMLGAFSKSVEMAFSWKGLRWRFDAWRTGQSFNEIVMLHSLVYRVERVFFIHGDTGLVLAHMEGEGVGSLDAEMVSAMLTAIQDFVRDCFAKGDEGALDTLRMGEFSIFIEKSNKAYLACIVRGTPHDSFRTHLRETLELMLVEFAEDLDDFSGDTEAFSATERYLESCLVAHYAGDNEKKLPLWAKFMPVLVVLLLCGGTGYYWYTTDRFNTTMREAVQTLRLEPGLVVSHVERQKSGPWKVLALKDALARLPEDVLRRAGFDPSLFEIQTIPYLSYDASIVTKRASTGIDVPDGVEMTFDKGTLSFRGTATMAWILETREKARSLAGVEHVDMRDLRDPRMGEIAEMVRKIESVRVEFPVNKDVPVPEDTEKLQKTVDMLAVLEKRVKEMGMVMTLTIYGHADATGTEKRNYEISQARARTVAAMLYARGSSMPIAMYGMGADHASGDGGAGSASADRKAGGSVQADRRIEFRVYLARAVPAGTEALLQ